MSAAGEKVATPEQLSEARRYAEYSDSAAMIPARMAKRAFAHIDALEAREKVLREALEELLAAELSQIPPAEDGIDAQNAWADRRAAARNNAAALLSPGEPQ